MHCYLLENFIKEHEVTYVALCFSAFYLWENNRINHRFGTNLQNRIVNFGENYYNNSSEGRSSVYIICCKSMRLSR